MSTVPDDEIDVTLDIPVYVKRFERLPVGTVRLSTQKFRWHLRWRFLEQLRSRTRFQHIVAFDLRPKWHSLARTLGGTADYKDLPTDAPYVQHLQSLVGEQLRCREDGRPSHYMLCEIHDIVRLGSRIPQPVITTEHSSTVELRVDVSTVGDAQVIRRFRDSNGVVRTEAEYLRGPFAAFQDWKGLEDLAESVLRSSLQNLREEFEASTRDHRGVHSSRLLEIRDGDLSALVDYLWSDKTQPLSRDKRRRLLKDLGFDAPSKKYP